MARISNVYNEGAVDACEGYGQYADTFGGIVRKDSPGKNFGFSERTLAMGCLDMDSVETAQPGSNAQTMDLVLGLSDFDDVRQKLTSEYLLPVELKLNCEAFNLKFEDFAGKDEHTRRYDLGVRFAAGSVYLFTEQVCAQAKSHVARWMRGTNSRKAKEWQVMTPKGFNSYVKFASDYPYHYQTDMNGMENEMSAFLKDGDADGCERFIQENVKPKMEEYYRAYNILEIRYVVEQLRVILDQKCQVHGILGDDKEYLMTAVDDIAGLLN